MSSKTESARNGEFLLHEASGDRSRENVSLAVAVGVVLAGTVLGQATLGATATTAPGGSNVGNGTISAVTLGGAAKNGEYVVTFIEGESDAGAFTVEKPDGKQAGTGNVGTEFSKAGLTFTISDGATDFVAGDTFTIEVQEGAGSFAALDLAASNGTQDAAGILFSAVDTSSGAPRGVAVVRDAEIRGSSLTWPDGISDADKAAATANLAKAGILIR